VIANNNGKASTWRERNLMSIESRVIEERTENKAPTLASYPMQEAEI
jgi:hypothetical protein